MAVQKTFYLIAITCFVVYVGQACAKSDKVADTTNVGESRAHPSFGMHFAFESCASGHISV